MPTWAVYLWPRGPVGQVHSDTLFGALCWAQRALHGRAGIENLLAGLPDHPPCAVSSCFPVVRAEDGVVRCYPMPMMSMAAAMRSARSTSETGGAIGPRERLRREMKLTDKVRALARTPYVSEIVFRKIVEDGLGLLALQAESCETPPRVVRAAGIWMDAAEARCIQERLSSGQGWEDCDIPRNHIDRVAGATVEGLLFSVEARFYREDVGLWFALRADSVDQFLPLLRYLGDTGIGGHRSTGLSQFAIDLSEIHEVTIPSFLEGDRFATLSRYIPAPGEVRVGDERLAYRLATIQPKHESRGGSADQRIYKGRLLVLEEGSILPISGGRKPFYGRIVPVGRNTEGPDGYAVWHNGLGLPAFLREGRAHG